MIGMLGSAPANAYSHRRSNHLTPARISPASDHSAVGPKKIERPTSIHKFGWPESLLEPTSVLDNYNIIVGSPGPSSSSTSSTHSSTLISSTASGSPPPPSSSSPPPTTTKITSTSSGSGSFISPIDLQSGVSSAVAVEGRPTDDHVNGIRGSGASGIVGDGFQQTADNCETIAGATWQHVDTSMRHRPWAGMEPGFNAVKKHVNIAGKDEFVAVSGDGADHVVADGSLEACVMSSSYNYSRIRKRDRGGEEEDNILGEVVHTRPAKGGGSHYSQATGHEKLSEVNVGAALQWQLGASDWNNELYNPQVLQADQKLVAGGAQLVDDLDEIFIGAAAAAPEYLSSELLNNSWLPPPQEHHPKPLVSNHGDPTVPIAISAARNTSAPNNTGGAAQLDLYEAMQALYRSGSRGAGVVSGGGGSSSISAATMRGITNYNPQAPTPHHSQHLHPQPHLSSSQPHEFATAPYNSTRPSVRPFSPPPHNLVTPPAFDAKPGLYGGQLIPRNLIDPNPPFPILPSSSSSSSSSHKFAQTDHYSQLVPSGNFRSDMPIKHPWPPNVVERGGNIITRPLHDPPPSMMNKVGHIGHLNVHPGHRPPPHGGHNIIVGRCVRLDDLSLAEYHLSLAAQAAGQGDLVMAQAILARLNQQTNSIICSPTRSSEYSSINPKLGQHCLPSHRAIFHFKEAFAKLLLGASSSAIPPPVSNSMDHIINKMSAYKSFFDTSLIPQFAHFTANQAILDALAEGDDRVHVIDFELGFAGGQWASFMQEFAQRSIKSGRSSELKITTIVKDIRGTAAGDRDESNQDNDALEIQLAKENLLQFANEVGLNLQVDAIPLGKLQGLMKSEAPGAVVVNFGYGSAARMMGELDDLASSETILSELLQCIRRLKPRVVALAESETAGSEGLLESLQFYACVFESLHESGKNVPQEAVHNIESMIFGPEIAEATKAYINFCSRNQVGAGGGDGHGGNYRSRLPLCRMILQKAGFSPLHFSNAAESQASFLVKNSGFNFTKQQERLVLGWYNKPLISASAWV